MTDIETLEGPACAPSIELQTLQSENLCNLELAISESDAVCVDYIDLGLQQTEWGEKHQCRFVFETNLMNESGYPIRISRTFTRSLHEKSALRPFIEQWRGESLTQEDVRKGIKFDALVGKTARIKFQDSVSHMGFAYLKLLGISPLKGRKIKPSGTYRRFEGSNSNN